MGRFSSSVEREKSTLHQWAGPPVPSDGILSEGEKRDSEGICRSRSRHCQDCERTATAAEVLCSGASVSDSAEEDLAYYRVTRPRGLYDSLELHSSARDVR